MKAIDFPSGENAGLTSPMIFSGGRVTSLLRLSRRVDQDDAKRLVRRRLVGRGDPLAVGGPIELAADHFDARGEQVRHLAVRAAGHGSHKDGGLLGAHAQPGDPRAVGRPCRAHILSGVGGDAGGLRAVDRLDVDVGVAAGLSGRRVGDAPAVRRKGRMEFLARRLVVSGTICGGAVDSAQRSLDLDGRRAPGREAPGRQRRPGLRSSDGGGTSMRGRRWNRCAPRPGRPSRYRPMSSSSRPADWYRRSDSSRVAISTMLSRSRGRSGVCGRRSAGSR